ncbi:MAG: c-type cytochrome [Armatimonadetes bacterium]|nr:c-type cytochrome [Armatimonadota bacterium]
MNSMRVVLWCGALGLLWAGPVLVGTPAGASGVSAETRALFEKHCKKCHGLDGRGQTAQGKKLKLPDWADPQLQAAKTDEDLLQRILQGYQDPENTDRKMKSFKDELTEAQARDLVQVVRAFGKPPGPFAEEK